MIIGFLGEQPINSDGLGLTGTDLYDLNELVRLAILTTQAGYKKENQITVQGRPVFSQKRLDRFLSYMLNKKGAAPMHFAIKTKFIAETVQKSSLPANDYDRIMSFSGGLDSTAGLLYSLDHGQKVLPLWIGFGQKSEADELAAAKKICRKLNIDLAIVTIDLKKLVDKGWKTWKYGIIPARNFLFAAIASTIAARSSKAKVRIDICAHKEEMVSTNTDKSWRFFRTASEIFSSFYQRDIELATPFTDIDKPEVVAYWEKNWTAKFGVSPYDTVSCYEGVSCGSCNGCFHRIVGFCCAGLPRENFRDNTFADREGLIRNHYLNRFAKLPADRRYKILYVFKQNEDRLNTNIKKVLSHYWPRLEKRIIAHIDSLRCGGESMRKPPQ